MTLERGADKLDVLSEIIRQRLRAFDVLPLVCNRIKGSLFCLPGTDMGHMDDIHLGLVRLSMTATASITRGMEMLLQSHVSVCLVLYRRTNNTKPLLHGIGEALRWAN